MDKFTMNFGLTASGLAAIALVGAGKRLLRRGESVTCCRPDTRRRCASGCTQFFAGNAYRELAAVGTRNIVTTNTIRHASNTIDINVILAECVGLLFAADAESQSLKENQS